MWELIVSVPDHCLSFYFIYRFINLLNDPSFSILFVLNSFLF